MLIKQASSSEITYKDLKPSQGYDLNIARVGSEITYKDLKQISGVGPSDDYPRSEITYKDLKHLSKMVFGRYKQICSEITYKDLKPPHQVIRIHLFQVVPRLPIRI